MNADVVVIGSGPAGIQAAISSSRRKADTVLLGKPSNSAISGTEIENYFGFAGVTGGDSLLSNGVSQAKAFGCNVIPQNVIGASADGGTFSMEIESGEVIVSKAVVIATGVSRNKLNIPGEKEFFGKGVSYCADCDCNFYRDVPVAVVGADSAAAAAAKLLSGYASKVYWVTEGMVADARLVDEARRAGAEIVPDVPVEIQGASAVDAVVLKSGGRISVNGVFIELGGRSSVDIAMDFGVMPEADDTIKAGAGGETSVEGVYACGDITGRPWQVAKAVGQGSVAGVSAADHSRR
ncbi:MAG: NAD(P)/FAD-dependent oxidoreductase [Candidatus Methanoplasma sp.]|jgi:thioredoxin reductase (NADPH)|nr:NAD(P)/FAD-dependent oxidoreductase [Candidatus Methanoplasma sp.]